MKAQKPRRASFIRFVLAAVLTAASAWGMLYLFEINILFSEEVLRYTYLAAVGIAAGVFTRLALSKYTGVLRFLTALFAVIAALWAADWISGGFIGIELLDVVALYQNYESLLEFDLKAVDPARLLVLGVPWLTAMFALRAWKRPAKAAPQAVPQAARVPEPAPAQTAVGKPRQDRRPHPRPQWGSGVVRTFDRVRSWPGQLRGWAENLSAPRPVTLNVSRRGASEPMVISAPVPPQPVVIAPPARKARKPKRVFKPKHDDSVKFVGAEEHSCPFCLEPVDLNDPRGVEICPICKAYHHKDCWDVTGMCQVPHHQGNLH